MMLKVEHTLTACPVKTAVIPACLSDLIDLWERIVCSSSACFLMLNEVTTVPPDVEKNEISFKNLHPLLHLCKKD